MTPKNLYKEAYRFHPRACDPAKFPIVPVLTYMLQSAEYIPAPEFSMANRKLDLSDADRLWEIVQYPERTTFSDTQSLLFDARSYGVKVILYI